MVGAALALAACTTAEEDGSPPQHDGLLTRLRDGGLTIVIRHAATD
jgi:hypothetical protein